MNTKVHIEHLRYEIEVLRSMVKEHGTGHIKTAIEVLKNRIEELEDIELESMRGAS